MKIFRTAFLAALASASIATSAMAGAGWEFTSPGNSFTDGQWDFATAFTVSSNVTLSGLGYYADPKTGNADGNAVSFYQCNTTDCLTTGTLLASTTVTNEYPLTGHFRYVTIAPITLLAGMSYEVAGVSNVDNYTWDDPGFATDSAITILDNSGQQSRWANLSTANFLTGSGNLDIPGKDGIWGPDIFLGTPSFTQSAPEPATWAMMGLGFLGLVTVGYRRSNREKRAIA